MPEREQDQNPFVLVLFGATGDLAKRKLFPALYELFIAGLLNRRFAVVGIGRSPISRPDFQAGVRRSVTNFSRHSLRDGQSWTDFADHFDFVSIDVNDPGGYGAVRELVEAKEREWEIPGNRLFYLAMPPDLFGTVSAHLKKSGLTETGGWKRLVIEKPFGHDHASAKQLNEQIQQSFVEDEIYRIDHYLGKEMVQNIEVIRFANSLFEPLWNNRYIANIQVTASETVGVEERAAYYERAGALRDMVQNHILQMMMMVAMEPPSRLDMEAIRDEKVKVLRSLRRFSEDEVNRYVVRGQYTAGTVLGQAVPGYREERNVAPDSATETFVAAKLFVDNFRWAGVPFFIRTGKRMAQKVTEIVIQFKEMPNIYFNKNGDLSPNLLIIRINPTEGMYLLMNAKKPGADSEVIPVAMEFCNNCEIESPEAYERLLHEAIQGDSTFFTRWDEVSLAWQFADPIRRAWDRDASLLLTYPAGSWGPAAADQLLAQDGAHWWPVYDPKSRPVVQPIERPGIFAGRY
ncbi:glucose-6-phosphate dehydrogenase [Effusibacillus pohliae]|uniref:glucose-6-phosphate dehydrogenase n=1 Tax=Effusibacillus pohliae TaxID=232270 RepID=UPI00037F2EDD|nr:glucose-6-phosphate dehydrogenase [Effusibacillus pohliae]